MTALIGFWILLFSIVIWNINTFFIFKRLRLSHPTKYIEMGEPSIFKPDFKALIGYLKFIYKREWRSLDDPKLSRICYLMPILLLLVIIGMFNLQNSISMRIM